MFIRRKEINHIVLARVLEHIIGSFFLVIRVRSFHASISIRVVVVVVVVVVISRRFVLIPTVTFRSDLTAGWLWRARLPTALFNLLLVIVVVIVLRRYALTSSTLSGLSPCVVVVVVVLGWFLRGNALTATSRFPALKGVVVVVVEFLLADVEIEIGRFLFFC